MPPDPPLPSFSLRVSAPGQENCPHLRHIWCHLGALGQNICSSFPRDWEPASGQSKPWTSTASACGGSTLAQRGSFLPPSHQGGSWRSEPSPSLALSPGPGEHGPAAVNSQSRCRSQGAGGAPTMNLGKLSPGWVSSSQGKKRLTRT